MASRHRGDEQHVHGGARHHGGERLAAAHRWFAFGDARGSHLGADQLLGGQRHHPAHDRVAGEFFRPQAALDGLGGGLHHFLVLLRPGTDSSVSDHLSRYSRRDGRRIAAAFTGDLAGSISF